MKNHCYHSSCQGVRDQKRLSWKMRQMREINHNLSIPDQLQSKLKGKKVTLYERKRNGQKKNE